MEKIKSGSFIPLPIVPIVIVGAKVNEKPSYLAVGCIGAINLKPPIIMISLNKTHYTTKGINENETFSINIPSTEQVIETDYCGLKSGKTTDKSKIFTTFYGDLNTAPMIKECPITCECKLIDTKTFPQCITYYGEVHQVFFSENAINGKDFNFENANLFFLSGLENLYRDISESKSLGHAYDIGWKYEKGKNSQKPQKAVNEPKIVQKDKFQILGVEDISKMEERDPAAVWARFQQLGSHIPYGDTSHALGIYITTEELLKESKNRYLVGVEVSKVDDDDVPEGFITETIPSQKYALFTHIGPLSTIENTYQYINEQWFPNNLDYQRVRFGVEFEW